MTTTAATVLAHQGGWDEMLFVLVPIALFALLLRLANRRASRLEPDEREQLQREDGGEQDRPGPPGLW